MERTIKTQEVNNVTISYIRDDEGIYGERVKVTDESGRILDKWQGSIVASAKAVFTRWCRKYNAIPDATPAPAKEPEARFVDLRKPSAQVLQLF